MKKLYKIFVIVAAALAASCNVMDLTPKDRVSADVVFSSEEGIRAFLANLYAYAPWQDFNYNCLVERNQCAGTNTVGFYEDHQTDNAIHCQATIIGTGYGYWDARFRHLRDVNYFLDEIPNAGSLTEEQKNILLGEGHFLRGWTYYDIARNYGGAPLIKASQKYTGDPDELCVPRSTEKETWDFVIEELKLAAELLPEVRTGADSRFANKYVALGILSRASLFAASIAKYGYKVKFEGAAADQKLVGIDAEYANDYYQVCIDASKQIIDSGRYSLHGANPANKQEAIDKLMEMFQNPNVAPEECMFICGYAPNGLGHSIELWTPPYQTRENSPHPGFFQPSIDLVDNYECYSRPGEDGYLETREDGDLGYGGFDPDAKYLHFTNAYDIFEDKDARLWSAVVLPFTEWKGKTIRIQNGFILENGTADIGGEATTATKDGVTYYKFGAASAEDYSGFDQTLMANMTRSGFCVKKFLTPGDSGVATQGLGMSTQDWAEIRYAEILLNYAEACVESGLGDQALAEDCLNATRHRAAFTTDIPLTIRNVQRDRRSELAFENKRFDDLIRRREFHELFDHKQIYSFDPILDMRTDPPQFIYVRKVAIREEGLNYTFDSMLYYNSIPGIVTNGLVQNPKW
ncbi:MAG: RagB/SusD family nutrient uptake outer membrane protein [Bacteroidales bacterium]|nr:RagB/SusD family nutrient uptake outer membrane protein [Bacteroidales bacterium]